MKVKDLTEGIDHDKYKWLYTNTSYKEEIVKYLKNNDINLEECWRIVDDQMFRKIRNRLLQERTSSPSKEKSRKSSR